MFDVSRAGAALRAIRERRPLIHAITNTVVQNFTANGLLALGASPVMADAPEEAGEVAGKADALLINLGTLSDRTLRVMEAALRAANAAGVPAVLDPVGVGATVFRTEAVERLLSAGRFAVIRGNVAEVANLIGRPLPIKGVDAEAVPTEVAVAVARAAAERFETVVAATGPEDVVTDGRRTLIVANGDPLMARVTGSGCLLGAIVAAFAAVEQEAFRAAADALVAFGVAGEIARERLAALGPVRSGRYGIALLDALDGLDEGALAARARVREAEEMAAEGGGSA
ncbi:MAG: Hydroxyethylthiazole kinase [Hydrogenibacillus schlegelii]|uniref:Hydroxyethylthiazole kinase n=1 Tax=Hydrogenibacillus schlegelii TaxID=1484 RepID=A0A2T5GCI9_HYDSH|nr:hydroxyethylthiazole kinase [Hydrogenibacillus schlegelii]PTQ53896.1 MAG: Hydroxyethylthiazole kinase [Hydrogenibacillus schlegelii]